MTELYSKFSEEVAFPRGLIIWNYFDHEHVVGVESRCGAVAVGQAYLLPPLSFGGASLARPWLCFHLPPIAPDLQISRIRLSDKTSRLRPRLAAPPRGQAYETVMPVEVREWISPAPASPELVLVAQPPA